MDKIIEYVNENSVDEMVAAIKNKQGLNLRKVINDLKQSRTDYGMKVQRVVEELLNDT